MISELECRRGDLISSATVAYPGFSLHLVCSLLKQKKRSLRIAGPGPSEAAYSKC